MATRLRSKIDDRPASELGRTAGELPLAPSLAERVRPERVTALAGNAPYLHFEKLQAGYGRMEILHGLDLAVARGQSLCLIGPNGAGKSTVLQAIFGFAAVFGGRILLGEPSGARDITRLSASEKLRSTGIGYVMQHPSVFPEMTVEENLVMGGYAMADPRRAREAAQRLLDKHPRIAARRKQRAEVLSGGERRLLEIARALVMDPDVLLIDEPSIGLEPRFIDIVFELLRELQEVEGKTILMVEQNAKKGLEFADLGYVLVAGELAMAGSGDELLADPGVGRLFLGG